MPRRSTATFRIPRFPRLNRLLFAALILVGGTPEPGTAAADPPPAPWTSRVAQPPANARILKIIHGWPDAPEAQDRLIERLRSQGFGGVVCNVSFDQYLQSEPKWQAFRRAIDAARAAGFALWLYDERGYPSANAGGLTLQGHPEWEARGLLAVEATADSGLPATLELPPGQPVLVRAYPLRQDQIDPDHAIDLHSQVKDRKLTWTPPPGRWRILALTEDRLFDGTHAEGNYHEKLPYPNLLLAEPTARFLDLTYGGYARHLGHDLSKYFEATFTDEPSLMSLFLRPMPWRPLPWSQTLPAEFHKRRGYALATDQLPALVADAGPGTARLRHDFWLTIGELVSENFFGQIQLRTRRHGIPSGGHLLAEEGLVGHVPLYGDLFRCIRRLDAPSIDCLTSVPSEVPWFIARLLASAAELEGRTLVMSETSDHAQVYRPSGDNRPRRVVTEAEIRGTAHRLAVGGVNVQTSYYSFTDLPDDALRRLNETIGRACTAVRGGHQVADIAVVYPIESLWTRFVPSRHWTREAAAAARIESLYRTAADTLFAARREFTFIDARALVESRVDAASASLTHGALRWRVVVLPGVDTLPFAAWERLAAFVRQGGVVVALGERPRNSETEFPSPRVRAIADDIFGPTEGISVAPFARPHATGGSGIVLPAGAAGLLPAVLDGVLEADVQTEDARAPVRVTHRRIEGHEVYLVINDSAEPWTGRLTLSTEGPGERWNLATGIQEDPLPNGDTRLSLEPYGATVLRYPAARLPRRLPVGASALPRHRLSEVSAVKPSVIRGEFVQAELTPDSTRSTSERPVWQARATLTKSQVDTFFFAQFHHAPSLDWTGVDHVELESWVPEGQSTPSQLLVILHEEGGGDFLVETGRSLAGAGPERTFLPLDRFQLAGWSKDADGRLDPKRIQDIRIGWGGYLGSTGERIAFSVAAPRLGRVTSETRATSSAPPQSLR